MLSTRPALTKEGTGVFSIIWYSRVRLRFGPDAFASALHPECRSLYDPTKLIQLTSSDA